MRKYVFMSFFLVFAVPLWAQWNPDTLVNNSIWSFQPNPVALTKIVPDGSGGFIAAWIKSDTSQKRILAQRVNGNGVRSWDTLGVEVALTNADSNQVDMASDPSAGGAFVVWKDNRPGTPGIYAQQLNGNGTISWTSTGVLVSGGSAVSMPSIVEGPAGNGAWVAWLQPDTVGNLRARLQHLFPNGTGQWPGGLDVFPIDSIKVKYLRIIEDGNGGVIVGVKRTVAGGVKDTISVRKFDSNGTTPLFSTVVSADSSSNSFVPFDMKKDNSGNIFISSLRATPTQHFDLQKVSINTGSMLWPDTVNTNIVGGGGLIVVPDLAGGAYVVVKNAGIIYAQRVNATGANQFGSTFIFDVTTVRAGATMDTLHAAFDGQGGLLLAWTDTRSGTNKHVYGQRLNNTGGKLWNVSGVTIAAKPGVNQSRVRILADGSGGMFAAWNNPNDISTARLYNTGGLVGMGTPTNLRSIQFGEGVKVFWNKIDKNIYPKLKNYTIIKSSITGFGPPGTFVASTPDTFIVDFPTPLGSPIYYRVAAVDSLNITGAYSSEVKIIPLAYSKSLYDTLTQLPRALSRMGAASIMENLYVIGGHGPVVTVDTAAFKYSPGVSFLNGSWQFAKRMTYARNNHGVVELAGKLYAFGGKDSTNANYLLTIEQYDPVNDLWSIKYPMNTACSNFGYAVLGGLIYVAGGSGAAGILNSLQAYNPNDNSWLVKANLPVNLSDLGLAAGSDGFLYAFGGVRQDSSINNKIYRYSPGPNHWDSLTTVMPTPRFAFGCVSFRGKIYLIGGRRDTSMAVSPVKTVEIFDPGTQTWSYTDNLPQSVSNFAATVYGPGIIIAGGRDQAYAPRSRVDFIIPNPVFAEIGKKMKGKLNEIIHVPIYINGDLSADSVFSIEVGVTYSHTLFDSSSVTIGPLGSQFGSNIEYKFRTGTARDTLYLAMGGSSRATGAGRQLLADMNIRVKSGTNGMVDSMFICRSIFNEGKPLLFRMPGTVRIQPVYGDVDMTDSYGTVSANDAAQVLQSRVKIITLNSVQQERADVSGRQGITAYDASLILQYIVGLISMFPPESSYDAIEEPAKIAPVGPQLVIRTDMERGVTENEIADVMIEGKGINHGQIVAIPVFIDNINSLYSLDMEFVYPKEHYEFLGARLGEPLKGFYMEKNCSDGHVIIALANSTPVSSGGKMVELYFRQLVSEGENINLISMLINEEDVSQYLPKSAKPDQFALSQNYPNPFNPTTQIRYQLPEAALVQLTIYNILGQEVRRLVNVNQNAGFYSVVWDGKNNVGFSVASGVYLYRLKAGSFVQSKKMIFLK